MVKEMKPEESGEPASFLWKIIYFGLNPKFSKLVRISCSLGLLVWIFIMYVCLKYTSDKTFLERAKTIIPLLFVQPAFGIMTLFVFNFHQPLVLCHATIKKLLDFKEFKIFKYRSLTEELEQKCNVACFILFIAISISYLLFHPITGKNLVPFEDVEYFQHFATTVNVCIFCAIIISIYVQIFSIFHSSHRGWCIQILHYRLKEYVEEKLCVEYDNFDIINSKVEQERIYIHLKRCAKFHLLLKHFLEESKNVQSMEILILTPLGLTTFVAGLFYIFAGLNPPDNFRIAVAMVTTCLVFVAYCFHGQQISDTFETLHIMFCSTSWVYWNTRNRNFLLILLPNTARKLEVTLAGMVDINYPLLLSAVKLSYSLLTVTMNFKE